MGIARNARTAAHLAGAVRQASRPGSPSLLTRVCAIPRMVRAVRTGAYTGVSSGRLAMLLAGVGYVISPVDLVPEGLLLVVGLVDDAMVLAWVAATLVAETEDFLAWEQGHAGAPGAGGFASAAGGTVPSHVVPPQRS